MKALPVPLCTIIPFTQKRKHESPQPLMQRDNGYKGVEHIGTLIRGYPFRAALHHYPFRSEAEDGFLHLLMQRDNG